MLAKGISIAAERPWLSITAPSRVVRSFSPSLTSVHAYLALGTADGRIERGLLHVGNLRLPFLEMSRAGLARDDIEATFYVHDLQPCTADSLAELSLSGEKLAVIGLTEALKLALHTRYWGRRGQNPALGAAAGQ